MTANTPDGTTKSSTTRLNHDPSGRWEQALEWITDRFSSISVKEARQALKSSQFFATYAILVAAVAICTLLVFLEGVSSRRAINYEQISSNLFYGYLAILGVPLGIVIPFSAYRSLSREYENGTIQLVSITTMKPYQILLGKFGTAMLQMLIYLSVLAPCIAMVYMLEGISHTAILMFLAIPILTSMVLVAFGLLLGGATQSHAISMAFSTLFLLGLGGLYLSWLGMLSELSMSWDRGFDDFGQMFPFFYGFAAFGISTGGLMLAAAASQISFESDNRSTPTRIAVLIQLFLFCTFTGMLTYPLMMRSEGAVIMLIFAAHYWLVIGLLMVGERPGMSNRVQRSLPKSRTGHLLFSLLMPGPGRGFLFVLGGMLATLLSFVVQFVVFNLIGEQIFGRPWEILRVNFGFFGAMDFAEFVQLIVHACLLLLHPLFILSVTFLLMKLVRGTRSRPSGAWGPILSLFLGGALLFILCISPLVLWELFYPVGYRYWDFDLAGSLNWYLAIFQFGFRNNSIDGYAQFGPFAMLALPVIFLAFFLASRELKYMPVTTPPRVLEDLQLEKAPKQLPEGESIEDIFADLIEPESPGESN